MVSFAGDTLNKFRQAVLGRWVGGRSDRRSVGRTGVKVLELPPRPEAFGVFDIPR